MKLAGIPARTYFSMMQLGRCQVCGIKSDLRMGACFDCSDNVRGRLIGDGVHQLWDASDPTNFWYVNEETQ